MALIRLAHALDPINALLTVQRELEQVLDNPLLGFDLGVSGRGVFPPVNVTAGEFTFQPSDLGVGYAYPITETFDVYGTASYSNIDADAPSFVKNTSDDGYTLGLGARTRLIEKLELEGTVKYANFSDYGDNTSFEFAGRWFFTDAFALGVEFTAGDEVDTFGAAVRYQFPAK